MSRYPAIDAWYGRGQPTGGVIWRAACWEASADASFVEARRFQKENQPAAAERMRASARRDLERARQVVLKAATRRPSPLLINLLAEMTP